VFSLYNEAETLPVLIERVRKVMSGEPDEYEMIFVNDCSTDGSVDVLAEEAKKKGNEDIVIVNLARRFGVEESFVAGVKTARGDAVIMMYTDMQDPPELIHRMLESWREGAEVVHSVRRRRIGEHPLKKAAAFFAYRIISRLAEVRIPIDCGEFKLISRNVAEHLLAMPEAEPYLRGLIPWIGFRQVYLEYDMQPRLVGKSKVPLFGKKAWTVFLSGVVSFSDSPVYLVLLAGIVGLALSALSAVMLLFGLLPGWFTARETLLIFLWASLMFSLGFVGVYIIRIYKNTRGRPRYIIQDTRRL